MTTIPVNGADEAIEGYEYLHEYKILVCKEHGFGLRNLRRHLLEQHSYSRYARDAIIERFGNLDIVNPEDAPLPPSGSEPFESLLSPKLALRCAGWAGQACEFTSTSKKRLARHCNEHGWKSDVGEREHWFPVTVQSFCPASHSPRWFIVKGSHEGDTVDDEDDSTISVDQGHRQTILQGFHALDDRHRQEQEIVDAPAETDQTGWWKKTGWIEHLQGSNKRHLAHAARLPTKDEPVVKQVGDLVEALVEDCVAGLSTLPQELRRWLKSVKMSETDPRPMGRLQNKDSQKRYAGYAKRLICYSLRVLESIDAVDIADPQNESGDGWINIDAMDTAEEGQAEPPAGGPPDTMADARRLFKWKEGQKEKARAVLRSIEGGDEEATQLATLLAFIETFVFSKVYHEPFDCPTVHFLAVLGIDEENDRLRTGNDYSYRVAGLVYCFRVFALEAVLPAEQRSAQGPAEFEAFLEQRKQYLTDGSMSAMSTMISLLAYGKYLAMNHGNAGAIFWEKEDKVMQLHGMRIVMDKFKDMVNRSIADAEDLLWERLLWTEGGNRFEMDISALEDDMSFRKRGSYFVTNRQNRLMSSWEDKTVTWMLASRRGSKMRQEDGSWHTRRVKEYLREVDKFRELLLFCMHVTGGQPARGPEVLSLRYKNGFSQDRNIFVLDGLVMSVTRYHKTQSQWDVPKAVPRFMPWRVGQLVTVYLTYVQPLMERLSVAIGHGCGRSEYLWADVNGPWDTTKLTKVMKQRSGEDLGVSLGTMDYRHAAVGMGRRFVGAEFARGYQAENEEVDESEVESDDPLEISAGRGSAIGVNRYAVPSDIVKHLSERNIQTFRPLSESWHRFLGLESRRESAEEEQRPAAKRSRTSMSDLMMPGEDAGGTPPRVSLSRMSTSSDCSITSVRSLPAAPLLPTTPRTPRTPATPSTTSTASTLRSWGSDSFCGSPLLQGNTDRADRVNGPPSPHSPTNPPAAVSRFARPSEEERSRAVRKALGKPKNAALTYRSVEQEAALNRIMDDVDTTLVVVLPTGGGKSLLFTAPACLDDPGMIVVVIPYRRLMDDTVRNARALRIDCLEWTYGVEDPATIVFISADRLSRSFFDYVGRMRSKGLLRKIFVDECHLAVTAHSWRPKVAELSELRGIGVPLVMLTATMPLYMESDLESTMSSTVSTSWIRANTARTTTKYTVNESIADGKLMEEAIRRCRNLTAQLKRRERMVAYCRSKADCEELAGQLSCGFFYAGNPDNPEALKKWLTEGGMIVATTALGTGVSYPGVMLVVHVGLPYGLIDFSQESGRAGRGGEQVDSLVLLERGWQEREDATRKRRRMISSHDERAMAEFVRTTTCRRLVLAKYFDRGEPVDCVAGEMARCDRCCSGVTDRQRSESRTAHERGVVTDALDQISGGCVVCWVAGARGPTMDWQHDGRSCRSREAVPINDGGQLDVGEVACDGFRETIRYLNAGHTCHRCGISQRFCNTGEEGGICQWPHVAVPLARLALACGVGRNIIRKAGYEGQRGDWTEYALWLGQTHRLRLWGELVSNSMVVISEFLIYCAQQRESNEEAEVDDLGDGKVKVGGREGEVDADADVMIMTASAEITNRTAVPRDGIEEVVAATPPQRRQAREIGPLLDVEQIRRLVDGWRDVCAICKARGRSSKDHAHWKECGSDSADKVAMEETLLRLERVKFQSFSGCDYCRRPQAVCGLWAKSTNAYGWAIFKKRQGVQCRYGQWLSEGAAALMAFGSRDWLGEERDGVAKQEGFMVEMGRKHRRKEVEFSGMFMYFYRWAW